VDGGDPAGGSAGLAELIDKYGDEIFADLLQYCGVNLVVALKPGSGFSPRQLLALIHQLPVESRTVAAIQGGPEFRSWTPDTYLLAAVIDAVRENTWAFVSANSKKKPKPPEPVKRPGKAKKKKTNSFAAMATQHLMSQRMMRKGR
jgi:hypothetical protein